MLVLDPLASVYASDENNRALVREFLDWLSAFAVNHPSHPLVMLVAHPAKAIAGEAAVYSGNTDWRNAPRAVWTLRRCKGPGRKKPGEGETDHYVALVLDKANYGPHPVTIPLSSTSVGEDAWRWIEARSINEAVANFAKVRRLTPAPKKEATSGERQPTKHAKTILHASERLVDAEPPAVISVDDFEKDYDEWHRSTYGVQDTPPSRNTLTRAMKKADRCLRFGSQGGVPVVKNCRFKPSAEEGET